MKKYRLFGILLTTVLIFGFASSVVWAFTGPHEWVYHDPLLPDYDDFNVCETCHVPHQAKDVMLWKVSTKSWTYPGENETEALCRTCHRPGNPKANDVVDVAGIHTPGHRFIDVYEKFRTNYEAMGVFVNNPNPVDRTGKTLTFPADPYDMVNARRVPCYSCHDPHGGAYVDYPEPTLDYNNQAISPAFSHGGYIPRYQSDIFHATNFEEIDGTYHSQAIYGETADFTAEIPSAVDAHNYFREFVGEDASRTRVDFPFSLRAYWPEVSNGMGYVTGDPYDTTIRWMVNDGAVLCVSCHDGNTQIAGITVAPPPLGPMNTLFGILDIAEHAPGYAGAQYGDWEFINCMGCHNLDDPGRVKCDLCHGFPPNDDDNKNDNVGAVGAHATHVFGETLSCPNCHYKNTHNQSGVLDGNDWNAQVPSSFVSNNVDIRFPTRFDSDDGFDSTYFVNVRNTQFDPFDSTYGPGGRPGSQLLPVTRNGFARGTTVSNGVQDGFAGPLNNQNYYDKTSKTCYIGCHNPIVFDVAGGESYDLDNAAVWPADTANPGSEVAIYTATLRCVDCHDQQGDLFDTNNPSYLSQHPNFLAAQQDSRNDCIECHQGHQWIERDGPVVPTNPNNWVPKLMNNPGNAGDAGTHPHTHAEGITYFMDPDTNELPDPSFFPTDYDNSPYYYIYDSTDGTYDTTMFANGFCQECHDQGDPTGENYFSTGPQAPGRIYTHNNETFIRASQHRFRADCRDCHRHHGAENLTMIKNNIDYPGADGAAVVLTDVTGPNSFDGGADGVCVVCHYDDDTEGTVSVHHHGLHADTPPAGTEHYNYDNKDCTSGCHMHDTGFMPDCNRCHRTPPIPTPGGMNGRIAALYVSGNGFSEYSTSEGAVGAHVTHVYGEGYKCDMCHYQNNHAETPLNTPDDWDRVVRDGLVTQNVDVKFDTSNMDVGLDTTEQFFYFFSKYLLPYDSTFDTIPLYDTTARQLTGEFRPVTVTLTVLPGGTTISNNVPDPPLPTLPREGDFYQYDPDFDVGVYYRLDRTCFIGCHNPIIGEEYEIPNVDNEVKWPLDDTIPGYDQRLYSAIACVACHDQQANKFSSSSHHPAYLPADNTEAEVLRSRYACTACHENHLWIKPNNDTTAWILFDSTEQNYKKHTHTEGVVVMIDPDPNWPPNPTGLAQDSTHQQYTPDDPNKQNVYYGRSFYSSGASQTVPADFCLECHNDIDARSDVTENSILNQIDTTSAPDMDLELYYFNAGHGKDSTAVTNHVVQRRCRDCHKYHGTPGAKLLDTTGNEVCFTCHENTMDNSFYGGRTQYEASRHALSPNSYDSSSRMSSEAGFCLNCHNPHGAGPNSYALAPPYQSGSYSGGYSNMTYYFEEKLCYRCHNAQAELWEEPPGSGTGNLNIQALFGEFPSANYSTHDVDDDVQGLWGDQIECTNCHNPHLVSSQTTFLSDPSDPNLPITINSMVNARDFCLKCHGDLGLPSGAGSSGEFPIVPSFPGSDTTIYNKEQWYASGGHGVNLTLSITNPSEVLGISCYQSNLDSAIQGCHTPHGSSHAKLIDQVNVYPIVDSELGGVDTPEEMNAMCLSACHQNKFSHTYTLWNGNPATGVTITNMNTGRPNATVGLPFSGGTELGIRGYDEVYDSEVFDSSSGGMIKVRRHLTNLPAYAQNDSLLGYGDTLPDYYRDYDSLFDTSDDIISHPSASWVPYDDDGDQLPDNEDFDVTHAPNYSPETDPQLGLPFFRKGSNETGTLDPGDATARGVYSPTINRDYLICVTCHEPHGTGNDTTSVPYPGMTRYEHRDSNTLCRKCHAFTP